MTKWIIEFINNAAEKEVQKLTYMIYKLIFYIYVNCLLSLVHITYGCPTQKISKASFGNYYLTMDKKIVILHTFIKKTEKTPKTAISNS